jgi:hypothetical protein
MGWRDRQKSLLLPVAGEIFLLTLPFIERRNRTSEVMLYLSNNATLIANNLGLGARLEEMAITESG